LSGARITNLRGKAKTEISVTAFSDEGIDGRENDRMRIFPEFGHVREERLALYALGDLPGSAAAESAPSARGFAFGALSRLPVSCLGHSFFFAAADPQIPLGTLKTDLLSND
jgi:hypothetical protein